MLAILCQVKLMMRQVTVSGRGRDLRQGENGEIMQGGQLFQVEDRWEEEEDESRQLLVQGPEDR